jgi:hypothetical protein
MPEHFFCSQMVRVKPKDSTYPAETVLLEEISPQAVVLSGGALFQEGVELLFAAEGFAAQLTVSQCEVREDSYVIRGDFGGGYRWSLLIGSSSLCCATAFGEHAFGIAVGLVTTFEHKR